MRFENCTGCGWDKDFCTCHMPHHRAKDELSTLRKQLEEAKAEIECEEKRFNDQQDLLHEVSTKLSTAREALERIINEPAVPYDFEYDMMVDGLVEIARKALDDLSYNSITEMEGV